METYYRVIVNYRKVDIYFCLACYCLITTHHLQGVRAIGPR